MNPPAEGPPAAASIAGTPSVATGTAVRAARGAGDRPGTRRPVRTGGAPGRALRALLVALACLATAGTHAQQVRGPAGSLLATVTDDEVRSATGALLYRLDGRDVRDASGRLWLRTDGGDVRSASGSLLGRFDGREVRDASGRLLGRVEGEDVRDPGGRRIGRVEGVSARQAALYFFFLR